MRVQVSETCSVPSGPGTSDGVLGDPDREPVLLLPRRGVQPAHAGPVGQPAPVRRVLEGQGDALFHAGDDVPAREQDRGDQVIAGEVPVEAGDAAREQLRALASRAVSAGSAPRRTPCPGRRRDGAARAGGQGDDPQLRERGGPVRGPGRAEVRPVLRRVRQVHQHPVRGAAPASRPA